MVFPFSELTDEEMTNALSCQDMTRLSEAMKTIANLENENKMLKDSVEASRTDLTNGQITQNKLKIEYFRYMYDANIWYQISAC